MGSDRLRHPAFLATFVLLACASGDFVCAEQPADPAAVTQFSEGIAPLIARRCLECHSAVERKGGLDLTTRETALAGGESGPAIVPASPDESLLWSHVEGELMPPEKPLSAPEKQLLHDWIAAGAAWTAAPIDPLRYSSDVRAGYDWWSLQPVAMPAVPQAEGDELQRAAWSSWVRSPIDAFIWRRLSEAGLAPSPEAERRVLLRRLTFDLWGLPPSVEMTERFLNDQSPGAYERLVDELLASPHYGQRWSRHWLDVARFGESQGFERDKLRTNSWAYRDWVVDSFNADVPYDRFASLQLAGDVLDDSRGAVGNDGLIASGFLVAGPYDEVGQTQQSEAMRAVVRQDELEDLVSVVGQTFLGLTVNCARCHDHKFDPVSQVEYYRLAAALAGAGHGEPEANVPRRELYAAAFASRRRLLEARLDQLEGPVREQILAVRGQRPSRGSSEAPVERLAEPIFEFRADANRSEPAMKVHGAAKVADERLHLDGKTGYAATPPMKTALTEKTLEAWVSLSDLDQRGGAAVSVQAMDGGAFDAIVFGENEPRRWMAGSEGYRRTQSFQGTDEMAADGRLVHFAIVYGADGRVTGYRDGRPYGEPYTSDGPAVFPANGWQVIIGLRHSPPGGNRHLAGAVAQVRVYDSALSAEDVAASGAAGPRDDYVSSEEIAARLTPADREAASALRFEIAELRDCEARALTPTVYASSSKPPEPIAVLLRGNPAQPGEIVAAGGVRAVQGVAAEFGLASDAPDSARRAALADWITDGKNPLFARVMVNRLWRHHFGEGLVESASDFGFNGGRPSHPELLDWLAGEFVRRGFSIKAIHRLICTSSVYRQASAHRAECAEIDAGSRLLWRKPPLRLEAEALRDATLFAAGELDLTLGGPGFRDFETYVMNSQFYDMLDPLGATFQRRSLYRTWVRSGRSALLDAFDCPDPSTKTPRRAVTTTPLQALALLNNSFMLRMAERFAERLRHEAPGGASQQIDLGVRIAYGRRATPEDELLAKPFIEKHGLSAFCRVLLNGNEFLFID